MLSPMRADVWRATEVTLPIFFIPLFVCLAQCWRFGWEGGRSRRMGWDSPSCFFTYAQTPAVFGFAGLQA